MDHDGGDLVMTCDANGLSGCGGRSTGNGIRAVRIDEFKIRLEMYLEGDTGFRWVEYDRSQLSALIEMLQLELDELS